MKNLTPFLNKKDIYLKRKLIYIILFLINTIILNHLVSTINELKFCIHSDISPEYKYIYYTLMPIFLNFFILTLLYLKKIKQKLHKITTITTITIYSIILFIYTFLISSRQLNTINEKDSEYFTG